MKDVVCALLEIDGKYLIAKRNYGNETSKDKWEFPGGKVEIGETLQQAIEREMREEFSVHVKGLDEVTSYAHDIPGMKINLRMIRCEYILGDFCLREHSEYVFETLDNIKYYDLCPGDKVLVEQLLSKVNS